MVFSFGVLTDQFLNCRRAIAFIQVNTKWYQKCFKLENLGVVLLSRPKIEVKERCQVHFWATHHKPCYLGKGEYCIPASLCHHPYKLLRCLRAQDCCTFCICIACHLHILIQSIHPSSQNHSSLHRLTKVLSMKCFLTEYVGILGCKYGFLLWGSNR